MRSQSDRLIDIGGLVLSGVIAIVFLAALSDRVNPLMNYREMSILAAMCALAGTALVILLMIVQAFGIGSRFTQERSNINPRLSKARLVIPIVIISTLLLVNQSGFPGTWASPRSRQQWAIDEFQNYDGVMKSIKSCREIVDRVGQVQFVAPTRGANYVLSDPGSSGHSGAMTLEIIGNKATGVGTIQFHIETRVGYVQFTHQGKTENLKCF